VGDQPLHSVGDTVRLLMHVDALTHPDDTWPAPQVHDVVIDRVYRVHGGTRYRAVEPRPVEWIEPAEQCEDCKERTRG